MNDFHINPAGDVKPCKATDLSNCPYSQEYPHFETMAEARQYYEWSNDFSSTEVFPSKQENAAYMDGHQPHDEGVPGHDVEEYYPDFYARPQLYASPKDEADQESLKVLKTLKGDPEAEVYIYRALPDTSMGVHPGNWVTFSPKYARKHSFLALDMGEEKPWPIVRMKVKAKDVRSPGDSINEWGYYPQ